LDHVGDPQVFEVDGVVGAQEIQRGLVLEVAALPLHLLVFALQEGDGLRVPFAALLAAGDAARRFGELLLRLAVVPRVLDRNEPAASRWVSIRAVGGLARLEPEVLPCYRFRAAWLESARMSEPTTERTCRKTYKEKLRPTPAQERELEAVLWRCRTLYNTALEQRITAWERCRVSVTRYQQEVELKAIRAEFPDCAAVYSHVLQDVLARLDKTCQAFFRRVQAGEKPGFPRFQGRTRYHSFAYKEYGNGARLENGSLVLSKIGRIAVHSSRPVAGTVTTVTISTEADGRYVCCSCAEVPTQPLPLSGRETGIDVGLKVFLITADGQVAENPRHYRKAECELKKAQLRVSRRTQGSKRRAMAARQCAKQQHVRRQRSAFHHTTALALVRQYDTISVEAMRPVNLSRRPEPQPDGTGGYEHNGASRKVGLNTSIQDAGWHRFLSILAYNAAWAGKRVEAVNPA
jgi:putative transposase